MIHLTPYKLFENEKPIISYDFDGVCHTSVIGLDPINFVEPETWEPFLEMHEQLKIDAENHRIVIVTARPPVTNIFIQEFVDKYKLPVEEIFATDNMPKTPLLKDLQVIKHYDDNSGLQIPLRNAGIEFVLVDPKKRTQQLMEGLNENNPIKNFEITFYNDKFFIADNTLQSFVDQLKNIDKSLIYDKSKNGSLKNGRIVHIKSSVINHEQIRNLISEFIKKYDWLKIVAVAKSV